MSFPTRRHAALGFAAAGALTLPLRAWAEEPPAEAAEADEPDTELDLQSSRWEHMMAPVLINGQGPFNFLMDTGANTSCVSHKLVDRLMLANGPPTRVHTVVGVRTHPSVMIDNLEVGARSRRAVKAPSMPILGPIDGVLGVDWLKGQRLVLDFDKKRLEITKSRQDHTTTGRVVVPARKRLGQLTIVDAELSGRKFSAMVDSGSQVTICNTPMRRLIAEVERGKRQPTPEVRRVRLESLSGEVFYGEAMFLPFMRIGGLHLGNVPVIYADVHVFDIWGLKDTPAIVLGMDLLTEFKQVALDFGRSQVRFDFVT